MSVEQDRDFTDAEVFDPDWDVSETLARFHDTAGKDPSGWARYRRFERGIWWMRHAEAEELLRLAAEGFDPPFPP